MKANHCLAYNPGVFLFDLFCHFEGGRQSQIVLQKLYSYQLSILHINKNTFLDDLFL